MPMYENNASKLINVSLITRTNENFNTPLDTNLLKSFAQYHTSIYGLNDNSKVAMLSMEPKKQIITLHNYYCLISNSISCWHIT